MKMLRSTAIGIIAVGALTCAALVFAQPRIKLNKSKAPSRTQLAQADQDRERGISAVRIIVTAEVEYRIRHGHFASWHELYSAPDEQKRWREAQISAGPEIIPGWTLSLVASADGKSFELSLRNLPDQCGFSFFSDEHGIIYQGGAIDCSIELKPTS